MTPELQIIDIHQDMIVSLNEEVDGLHDALGILRSEIEQLQAEVERFKRIGSDLNVDNVYLHSKIEQLQATVAELEAENLRLKQQFAWPEMGESYNWPKAGPPVKCADARLV